MRWGPSCWTGGNRDFYRRAPGGGRLYYLRRRMGYQREQPVHRRRWDLEGLTADPRSDGRPRPCPEGRPTGAARRLGSIRGGALRPMRPPMAARFLARGALGWPEGRPSRRSSRRVKRGCALAIAGLLASRLNAAVPLEGRATWRTAAGGARPSARCRGSSPGLAFRVHESPLPGSVATQQETTTDKGSPHRGQPARPCPRAAQRRPVRPPQSSLTNPQSALRSHRPIAQKGARRAARDPAPLNPVQIRYGRS